ncbi:MULTISPECIES: hypothetical protein [unclassified Sphingobium]|uniref:hypothetical protein n=1 Tax=unclassified Sphingobium TaxID=2611147 RepID=UPI00222530B8|nr:MULTISPECIES: hypothetical protein [unclassified Sphingobium]MCW2382147.1 hypothetical protein [Sphingobium sp. B2D3B]MCW2397680.1 hypothetical protein [Sphingobium sp. B2D3C]
MESRRDAIYYQQLARVARLKADNCGDADVARRLREAAILHERTARRLQREGSPSQPEE